MPAIVPDVGSCFARAAAELHRRRSDALSVLDLIDVERSDLLDAAARPGRLRSADALHLVTALRVGVDAMAVYDDELAAAAEQAGIAVIAPT